MMTTKKILILGMLVALTSTAPGFCGNSNDDLTESLVNSTRLTASTSNLEDLESSKNLAVAAKKMVYENEPVKKTWGQWVYDTALWTADATKDVAKLGTAYLTSYYGQDLAAEAIALAAGAVVSPVVGPVVAKVVHDGILAAHQLSKVVIPGSQGVVAYLATPYVKPITDTAILYAPFAAKKAYQAAQYAGNSAYCLGSYLSSWVY